MYNKLTKLSAMVLKELFSKTIDQFISVHTIRINY